MNWLRRLIPWAFKHDWRPMDPPLDRPRWLICRRCGMGVISSHRNKQQEWIAPSIVKRGCRGAP